MKKLKTLKLCHAKWKLKLCQAIWQIRPVVLNEQDYGLQYIVADTNPHKSVYAYSSKVIEQEV